jgi:hypothetical protein
MLHDDGEEIDGDVMRGVLLLCFGRTHTSGHSPTYVTPSSEHSVLVLPQHKARRMINTSNVQ